MEQPVLTAATEEEEAVTVTDEETGALTPEGNLTLVDDYHTDYSDGSGQQFITLVSKSGNTFYLVIDRNAKGQQTVHFMNLVDEAVLLALMEEDAADAYTAEKEAAAQAEQDRLKAEGEAKKAAEEAAASGTETPKENKVTKIASGFLGVVVLIALAAGGGFYAFTKQKQKKQAEKEALDPDANYTEDKGDFEILSRSTTPCKTLSSTPSIFRISISMSWIAALRQTRSSTITPTSASVYSTLFRSA